MDLELAIARVEAELEAHTRAWAEGGVAPPGPVALLDDRVRRVLARAAAQGDARAGAYLAIARLAAIEADPAVARARAAAPTWDGLYALTAARIAAARGRLLAIAREALGVGGAIADAAAIPPAIDAWRAERGPAIEVGAIARIAGVLGVVHGVDVGGLRVRIADEARTFVVTPGRDVRVDVRAGSSLARWSEALHEVGHALVGLGATAEARPPRAVDEGIAAWIARHVERAGFARDVLGVEGDVTAIARAARSRAVAQRVRLAAFEARLLAGDDPPRPDLGVALTRPTAALWHEPGAQLAYACADRIADALDARHGDGWPTAPLQIADAFA